MSSWGISLDTCTPLIHVYRNIEIQRTDICASTIHALFEFDGEYKTKIDFTKQLKSVADLLSMEVLLLDEVSMIDDQCFAGICEVLSIIDHSRRPNAREADCFGPLHLIMFGDFKQDIQVCAYFVIAQVYHCHSTTLNGYRWNP